MLRKSLQMKHMSLSAMIQEQGGHGSHLTQASRTQAHLHMHRRGTALRHGLLSSGKMSPNRKLQACCSTCKCAGDHE